MIRVLVTGGRAYADRQAVERILDNLRALESAKDGMVVIQGGAAGADRLARTWAKDRDVFCPNIFKPEWARFGKSAGPRRNQRMLDEGKPDLVVAFPGGDGTADMVRRASKADTMLLDLRAADGRT